MKRCMDLSLCLVAAWILLVPCVFIALAVRLGSPGPALYWSDRVGRHNKIFRMPKFRSMRIDTPTVATHLLEDPKTWLTPAGEFLRKSSLDELPQLWCILLGEMSFVGPRPALYNQHDLIEARTHLGIHTLRPGLTGTWQISDRNQSTLAQRAEFDADYERHLSFFKDLKILLATVNVVLRATGK